MNFTIRIRSEREIREKCARLESNLNIIKNEMGKANVLIAINTLKEYLDNSNVDLISLIKSSNGERKQTLKWISGIAS